jgi:hypothetical protein
MSNRAPRPLLVIPAKAGIQGVRRAFAPGSSPGQALGPRFRGDDEVVGVEEDRVDLASAKAHGAYEQAVGWDAARRNYLSREETERLLDGENPVRLWRVKRGLTQRALAKAAQIGVGYLAEIEGGKKPGSAAALQRINRALGVPMEDLVT